MKIDVAATTPILQGLPDKVKQILQRRVQQKPALIQKLADIIRRLWKHKALKTEKTPAVERAMRAILTVLLPDTTLPDVKYSEIVDLAKSLRDEKRAEKRERSDTSSPQEQQKRPNVNSEQQIPPTPQGDMVLAEQQQQSPTAAPSGPLGGNIQEINQMLAQNPAFLQACMALAKKNAEQIETGSSLTIAPQARPEVRMPAPEVQFEEKDMFSEQRLSRPPVAPSVLWLETVQMGWKPASPPGTEHFEYATPCRTRADRLWAFYVKTPWEDSTNAFHGGGTESVPAVTTKLGPTLNWWINSTGRIKVDGKQIQVSIINSQLAKGFGVFDPSNPTHTAYTGNAGTGKGKINMVATAEAVIRRQRNQSLAGMSLIIEKKYVFDPNGKDGLWDVLHDNFGARNLPSSTSTPWAIALRMGAVVTAFIDGRIRVQSTHVTLQDLERVEALLITKMQAKWVKTEDIGGAPNTSSIKISYGTYGEKAHEFLDKATSGSHGVGGF